MKRALTQKEKRVVHLLFEDWEKPGRCTTIDQAMERVGLPYSHEQRMKIATFLTSESSMLDAMRWDFHAYILTNEEKLIARFLLKRWNDEGTLPDTAMIGRVLHRLFSISSRRTADKPFVQA
ncbi:MAG: hypothetical protein HY731_15590 [Candidatus Tectomicrobia bacterium]|nr:hypothetical protein [Candidatus Tectomicrobia bacterium]